MKVTVPSSSTEARGIRDGRDAKDEVFNKFLGAGKYALTLMDQSAHQTERRKSGKVLESHCVSFRRETEKNASEPSLLSVVSGTTA